jgi:hypothetical protein
MYSDSNGVLSTRDGTFLVKAIDRRQLEDESDAERGVIYDAWRRPLVIRRVGDEWIVYSTGPDGIDNDRQGDDLAWEGPLEYTPPARPQNPGEEPATRPASAPAAEEKEK